MEYFLPLFRDFQKSFVGSLKVGLISEGQKNSNKYPFVAYFEKCGYPKKASKKWWQKSPKKVIKMAKIIHIGNQKYSRLRCLLHVKGLVFCFYFGWSGSILQFRQNIIKVGSKSWLLKYLQK